MNIAKKLAEIWSTALSPVTPTTKYKIIDEEDGKYVVQCSSLRAVMKLSLDNIVSDLVLILGFSPEQACFLGVKAAQFLEGKTPLTIASMAKITQKSSRKYKIASELRGKKICFIDEITFQEHIMCPLIISTSPDLIENFSPGHSFYIGYLAGTIILSKQCPPSFVASKPAQLRIVK